MASTSGVLGMTGLLFHSVDKKPGLMNMSRYPEKRFADFLDYLMMNNAETITVRQHTSVSVPKSSIPKPTTSESVITESPISKSSIPVLTTSKPTIAITFDDGLLSFYDNAYPLLEEKNIKVTLFPVAGLIGKTGGWDVMGKTPHMTAAMLREIASSGHEIGSHSLTHANLIWLDDKELAKELRDSKSILEDITGTAVKSLSFPFGSWNNRVWAAAKSAGYEYAAAYRGHRNAPPEMLPVMGAYRFDSVNDLIDRALPPSPPTVSSLCSKTTARIMSHFSKGTPIVKFRKEYVRFPWG